MLKRLDCKFIRSNEQQQNHCESIPCLCCHQQLIYPYDVRLTEKEVRSIKFNEVIHFPATVL